MDYFNGLTARVLDTPPELWPRAVSEFETESLAGDDALEEEAEEVVASQLASSPLDRSLPPEPEPRHLARGDSAALDKDRAVHDDPRAENDPAEGAPPPSPVAPEQHVPNEVVNAELERTAEEEPTLAGAPQPIAATEPLETPVPVPLPTAEASSVPHVPVEQTPARQETKAGDPTHEREERETTRVVRVRAEINERKGEPVEVELGTEAPSVPQSTRVVRVPTLIEEQAEVPQTEDQETVAAAVSTPEPQSPKVQETPGLPAKSVVARTDRVQRRPEIKRLRAQEKPEPNVVEIHIGRIEVKPPDQAPRPAAKPRVGRLNLDDVLNRRRTEKR